MRRKRKSRNQLDPTQVILLITAIIHLIIAVIDLIKIIS